MLGKARKVSEYQLPINIEPQDEGGYVITCPIWDDCFAQGDTIDEAILGIIAVAQSLVELYKEEGLNVPLKSTEEKRVDNPLNLPIIVGV